VEREEIRASSIADWPKVALSLLFSLSPSQKIPAKRDYAVCGPPAMIRTMQWRIEGADPELETADLLRCKHRASVSPSNARQGPYPHYMPIHAAKDIHSHPES
jgi:hypothetical protein